MFLKGFYEEWDDAVYESYLKRFALDPNKKELDELSDGMKVKYALSLALSHNAQLLILDEPPAVLILSPGTICWNCSRN